MTNESLLGIKETAKILGVTQQTLRNWDKWGKLKSVRTPTNRRKYRIEDIDNIINNKWCDYATKSNNRGVYRKGKKSTWR